jgi:hypothetical protein
MTFNAVENASLSIPKSLQDMHNMNCSTLGDDILSRNVSHMPFFVDSNFSIHANLTAYRNN